MRYPLLSAGLILAASAGAALAAGGAGTTVTMHKATASGEGEEVGTVTIGGASGATVLAVDLHGLPPGEHGFHLHEKGDCGPGKGPDGKDAPALAAGGHLDPKGTKAHKGPTGDGHLGDLPVLKVGPDGTARASLTVPRIYTPGEYAGHALMIHAGGDNYSDQPDPLGGGKGRIACGVVR